MRKKTVLFISTHNGARSQMAEAFLNTLAGESFIAESAGLKPGFLDPFAIDAMKESGIDISGHAVRNVHDLRAEQKFYNYVIETCDREILKESPSFPGSNQKIRWLIENVSYPGLSEKQALDKVRKVRDEIRSIVLDFITSHMDPVQ
jgi:arsenate reductase (thioredoxin)